MRKRDKAIVAGTAAAFAVAGAGAGIAATDGLSGDGSLAVIDDAAQQLGVEPSELSAALKQALQNRIDEAVEEGRLTEEQGDALKERIESADVPLVFGGFGRDFDHGFGFGRFHFGKLDAAATYLGLSEDALQDRLQDGQSLADIAEAENKSVTGLVDAFVAEATEQIDEAVADGRLTEERASELKADLEERYTELVDREPGSRESFRDGHLGPGFGPGFAPGTAPRGPRFGDRMHRDRGDQG